MTARCEFEFAGYRCVLPDCHVGKHVPDGAPWLSTDVKGYREILGEIAHVYLIRLHNTKAKIERTWQDRAIAAEAERDRMYKLALKGLFTSEDVEKPT